MITDHAAIIERMRELVALRVPFHHQGRSLHGIDCVGALCYAVDYTTSTPIYGRDPVNGELEKALTDILGAPIIDGGNVTADMLKPCDILAMQYAGPIRHVGMALPHPAIAGALSIAHTDSNLGRVTEHSLDAKWLRRIAKVWRL